MTVNQHSHIRVSKVAEQNIQPNIAANQLAVENKFSVYCAPVSILYQSWFFAPYENLEKFKLSLCFTRCISPNP